MRRLLPVVLATLLAALLLVPAAAASVDPADPPADLVVLAAEGGDEGPVGPEPNLTNSNAPAEYEPPFLINAAVGLAALMVLLVVGVGGLYWLLVQRPKTASRA